jgi:hypothetical protein
MPFIFLELRVIVVHSANMALGVTQLRCQGAKACAQCVSGKGANFTYLRAFWVRFRQLYHDRSSASSVPAYLVMSGGRRGGEKLQVVAVGTSPEGKGFPQAHPDPQSVARSRPQTGNLLSVEPRSSFGRDSVGALLGVNATAIGIMVDRDGQFRVAIQDASTPSSSNSTRPEGSNISRCSVRYRKY